MGMKHLTSFKEELYPARPDDLQLVEKQPLDNNILERAVRGERWRRYWLEKRKTKKEGDRE